MKKNIVYILAILLVPALVLGAVMVISNVPVSSDDPYLHFLSGNINYQRGEYQKAAESYAKAVELNPGYEEAESNLAVAYNAMGEFEKATLVLKSLIAKHPDKASYHYDYAISIVLSIQKDNTGTIEEIEEAIKHFEESDRLEPGYLNARQNISFLTDLKIQYYGKLR